MAKFKKASKEEMIKMSNGVSELQRKMEHDHSRKRINTTITDKVSKHLKEKYGKISDGINILALKDMGEL